MHLWQGGLNRILYINISEKMAVIWYNISIIKIGEQLMSKRRMLMLAGIAVLAVILNVIIINYKYSVRTSDITMQIEFQADESYVVQAFYLCGNGDYKSGFNNAQVRDEKYKEAGTKQQLTFKIPALAKYIRLDMGDKPSNCTISNLTFSFHDKQYVMSGEELTGIIASNDVKWTVTDSGIEAVTDGEDPYIVWDVSGYGFESMVNEYHGSLWVKIIWCAIIDLFALYVIVTFEKSTEILRDIWKNKRLVMQLARNDFKTKFAGSYLGIIWAFIQPIITVLVYWFVFEKGLKAGASVTGTGISVPYVLWLIGGIVPWFYFSDGLSGGTNALIEYSYLVKKVVFQIDILPVVKVMSAMFVHAFFVVFSLVLFACYGFLPDLYTLQVIYYSIALFILVLGLVYLTSAIVAFFKDMMQIVMIILQVGIWVTPIMWNIETMQINGVLKGILKLNPLYYIVMGYRNALIDKIWFWENPGVTLYFWTFTIIVFMFGSSVFKKLKVHFADVM